MTQGILLVPYTLIQSILIGLRGCFVLLTLYHYALKSGQLSPDLHLNMIKSEELGPFLICR